MEIDHFCSRPILNFEKDFFERKKRKKKKIVVYFSLFLFYRYDLSDFRKGRLSKAIRFSFFQENRVIRVATGNPAD